MLISFIKYLTVYKIYALKELQHRIFISILCIVTFIYSTVTNSLVFITLSPLPYKYFCAVSPVF